MPEGAPLTPLEMWRSASQGTVRSLVSVSEARDQIFGHPSREGAQPQGGLAMKTLRKLKRRGIIGDKVKAYFPEPSPLAKHPIVRKAINEVRLERIALARKLGRAPPKKGEGKRATRGKK